MLTVTCPLSRVVMPDLASRAAVTLGTAFRALAASRFSCVRLGLVMAIENTRLSQRAKCKTFPTLPLSGMHPGFLRAYRGACFPDVPTRRGRSENHCA